MKEVLYIMSSKAEVIRQNNNIKCSYPDPDNPKQMKKKIIPIARLSSIEVYGNIKISVPLLRLCNELKIPCYFNTYHGNPIGQFIPENPKTSILKLQQYKTYFNPNRKLLIAKSIVRKACKERIRLINKYSPNKNKARFLELSSKLNIFLIEIESIKNINQLRGIEGNLMKIFFKLFSEMLKNLKFKDRSQQPPKDEPNALLSYGNVMLYNRVRAFIYRTALDPLIGFLHEPHENRNSLALDIAEIFRPIIIDNLIIMLDRKKNILPIHFEKDTKKCHLNSKGKKIWIENFNSFLKTTLYYPPLKRNVSVQEEIKLECYNLIKFLTNQTKSYNPIQFNNR